MIRDKIDFYKDYSHLNIICYGCHMYGHILKYCPSIHYIVDKLEYIRYYLSCNMYYRRNFQRASCKKKSWKNNHKRIIKACLNM